MDLAFNRFIPMYQKNYQTYQEYTERKAIFQENYEFIQENVESLGVEMRIN
jgi:hypothetical protein